MLFGKKGPHDTPGPRLDVLADTEPGLDALLSFVKGRGHQLFTASSGSRRSTKLDFC